MSVHAFTIRSIDAVRNPRGEIVVAFSDLQLSSDPIVIVTPFYDTRHGGGSGGASVIPTVTSVSNTMVTINDENSGDNYYINVLLAESDRIIMFYGLPGLAKKYPKTAAGILPMDMLWFTRGSSPVVNQMNIVNLLTPFYKDAGHVRSVETALPRDPGPNVSTKKVQTSSNNAASNYSVNHLSIGINESTIGECSLQLKNPRPSEEILKVKWENHWDVPPVVFATPHWKDSTRYVSYQETILSSDNVGCEIQSRNIGPDYYVGVVAIPHGVPRITNTDLEKEFDHFLTHFPEHTEHINTHKEEIKRIILHGGDPSEAFKAMQPIKPSNPIGERVEITDLEVAAAKVVFDCASIIVAAAGIGVALSLSYSGGTKVAIEAAVSESSALVQATANAASEFNNATGASGKAAAVLGLSSAMFHAGCFRTILVAIFDSMPPWRWAVTAIQLAAQLTAIIAAVALTDGAGTPVVVAAWIGRVIAAMGSVTSLVEDSIALDRAINA